MSWFGLAVAGLQLCAAVEGMVAHDWRRVDDGWLALAASIGGYRVRHLHGGMKLVDAAAKKTHRARLRATPTWLVAVASVAQGAAPGRAA